MASDINSSGQIVGTYFTAGGQRGFLLNGGVYTTLHVPGSNKTIAAGINDSGDIVGGFADAWGEHGFLLKGGTYVQLDFPGAVATGATGINSSGQIAGTYVDTNRGTHGFLLSDGVYTAVDVPGSPLTRIFGINDLGQLVGEYFTGEIGNGAVGHGFLASPAGLVPREIPGLSPAGLLGLACGLIAAGLARLRASRRWPQRAASG